MQQPHPEDYIAEIRRSAGTLADSVRTEAQLAEWLASTPF